MLYETKTDDGGTRRVCGSIIQDQRDRDAMVENERGWDGSDDTRTEGMGWYDTEQMLRYKNRRHGMV